MFANIASADQKVIWSCAKYTGSNNVLWLVEDGDDSYVKVFEDRIKADYRLDGLNKRWDFGLQPNNRYSFAIVLEPDLSARYYDFSLSDDGTAKASQTYRCKKG